jgi:hypothetical protein
MKKLSDCRVLLVDDAKANLDILVEGLKPDHKLSLATKSAFSIAPVLSAISTASLAAILGLRWMLFPIPTFVPIV